MEIAFLLVFLSVCLTGSGLKRLVSCLEWGAIIGVAVSFTLTYAVFSGWKREMVELTVNSASAVIIAGLIAWLAVFARRPSPENGKNPGAPALVFIFLSGMSSVAVPALNTGLDLTRYFSGLMRPTGSQVAGQLGLVLVVLGTAAVLGVVLCKAISGTRHKLILTAASALLTILLFRDFTTMLQIALIFGILPLTDWLFRIVVPLVNNFAVFFYTFLAGSVLFVLAALGDWRGQKRSTDGLNPAQKRKEKSLTRRTATQFFAFGLILFLALGGTGVTSVMANRPLQLSPATAVTAENGTVRIPVKSLADGKLHRFSFSTANEIQVRFLMIYKGNDIYGVALDACAFCGPAGYRQEKENVVCNKCNAAINKNTIGFTGGCNPIRISYEINGEFVTLPARILEAIEGIFER